MRATRLSVLSFAAAGLSTMALAATAQADTAVTCAGSFKCSDGSTSLHQESRAPLMSSIGTGWLPACATPDAMGHCGSSQPIQVSVSMDLAAIPTPSTEPLWMVDMVRTTIVNAAWPTTKEFDLTIPTSKVNDGTFKVTHTLIPSVRVHASLLGINADWMYDASRFLIDNAANFKYKATNTALFAPWAFETKVINLVPAPSLTTTSLLNVKLINDGNNNVDLGLSASTSPTFTYRTTKVSLAGATPITTGAKTGKLPMADADYLDLNADVEGEITVTGDLIAAPYVAINKIAGISVPGGIGVLDLTSALNAPKVAYTAAPPVAVKFPQVKIHIPLPNVKVPSELDLGTSQIGTKVEQSTPVKNTGELAAKLAFQSSDPQFVVVNNADAAKKADFALLVAFTPTKEGPQTATITVSSNDPDQPSQTLTVNGIGSKVPVAAVPPAPPSATTDNAANGAEQDSGCGCHTVANNSSSKAGLAGLLLAAGLVLARRRRST